MNQLPSILLWTALFAAGLGTIYAARKLSGRRFLIAWTYLCGSVIVAAAFVSVWNGLAGACRSPNTWALATTALLTERNHERHDLLGGRERSDANVSATQKLLREWWGIGDRESLLAALRWIDEEGHRARFDLMGRYVATLGPEELAQVRDAVKDDAQKRQELEVVLAHHAKLGDKSLLGWDYGRYVALCRWGYLVGYLTEDEAWSRILPAARRLQNTFDSWKDLGENYLIGREFWSQEETERNGLLYRQAYQRLLDDPASPWNRCAWDLALGGEGGSPTIPRSAPGIMTRRERSFRPSRVPDLESATIWLALTRGR